MHQQTQQEKKHKKCARVETVQSTKDDGDDRQRDFRGIDISQEWDRDDLVLVRGKRPVCHFRRLDARILVPDTVLDPAFDLLSFPVIEPCKYAGINEGDRDPGGLDPRSLSHPGKEERIRPVMPYFIGFDLNLRILLLQHVQIYFFLCAVRASITPEKIEDNLFCPFRR